MNHLSLQEIVFSPADIKLKTDWQRLQAQTRTYGLSMEYEWFKSCAEACHSFAMQTLVLVVTDTNTDKVVALIPYNIKNEMIYRFFAIKAIYLMRVNREYGDHYELLIAPEYFTETIEAIALWMAKHKIDIGFINNIQSDTKLNFLDLSKRRIPWRAIIDKKIPCPYIRLPSQHKLKDWSTGKFKRTLQYKRKLEKSFQVSYAKIETHDELSEALTHYKIMHTARFSKNGTSSSICSDPLQFNFLDRLTHNALECGMLKGNYIKLNGKIAAVEISFSLQNKLFAYTVAFDDKYSQYRIGAIQTLVMIENAIAQGLETIDLLQGDEGYKQLWSQNVNHDLNLILFPKNKYANMLFLVTVFRRPLKTIYQALTYFKDLLPKVTNECSPRELRT